VANNKDSKYKSKNHAKSGEKRPAAAAIQKDKNAPTSIPRITAAGHGAVAEKILDIAFEHGIKVRKDDDLAEILAKINDQSEIPTEALLAVAEILAYIYQTNREKYAHLAPETDDDSDTDNSNNDIDNNKEPI
jgi:flagellar biosynthesis protein